MWCFNALHGLKPARGRTYRKSNLFTDFQPRLARAMMSLERTFRRLSAERRRLVARKSNLAESWCVSRLRLVDRREKAINQMLATGYSLGDAFAWFFYQFDPNMLRQHAESPRQRHPPVGYGGLAEVGALNALQGRWPWLALLHSTTSLLRLGDITIFNLSTLTVDAIVEVKSGSRSNDVLAAEMSIVQGRPGFAIDEFTAAWSTAPHQSAGTDAVSDLGLNSRSRARQRRQLEKLTSLLQGRHSKPQIDGGELEISQPPHSSLDSLIRSVPRGRSRSARVSDSLVLVAFRSHVRNADSYRQSESVPKLPATLNTHVRSTVASESSLNFVHMGSIHYQADASPVSWHGSMPVFWWKLGRQSLRDLLFHEIAVVTLWNHAHLIQRLEAEGLQVDRSQLPKLLKISRSDGQATRIYVDASYAARVPRDLANDDSIVRAIRAAFALEIPSDRGRVRAEIYEVHPLFTPEGLHAFRMRMAEFGRELANAAHRRRER